MTDRIDLAELTRRLGLPAHEQQAVHAWTNATDPDPTWTEREAAELVKVWRDTAIGSGVDF